MRMDIPFQYFSDYMRLWVTGCVSLIPSPQLPLSSVASTTRPGPGRWQGHLSGFHQVDDKINVFGILALIRNDGFSWSSGLLHTLCMQKWVFGIIPSSNEDYTPPTEPPLVFFYLVTLTSEMIRKAHPSLYLSISKRLRGGNGEDKFSD